MKLIMNAIQGFFEQANPPFVIERNRMFDGITCDIYGFRKAGMAGRDYFFVYDNQTLVRAAIEPQQLHEYNRAFANSFFKMPKCMRIKVPNIVTILVADNGFSMDLIEWVARPTRSIVGGEIHSVYLIDTGQKCFYGQGTNKTRVPGSALANGWEFKSINPQNRAYYLLKDLCGTLFKE